MHELRKSGDATPAELELLGAKLAEAQKRLDELDTVTPSYDSVNRSLFLRFFMGQVNVRSASKDDRRKLREEYEKFKDRTNYGFIVFPLIWAANFYYLKSAFRYTDWIYVLTHIWLLYYYISLALRENILRMNGSRMRQWWITHHYVSAAMSVVVLTWPTDSRSWERFLPVFTAYFLYQGTLQFMQARYQKARHYARTAMGRVGSMDVTHTETVDEVHSGLYIIVFLAFVAQIWQIYNGLILFHTLIGDLNLTQPWYQFREEVQCIILGVFFIFLGVTNFRVTLQTLYAKKQRPASSPTHGHGHSHAMGGLGSLPAVTAPIHSPLPVTLHPASGAPITLTPISANTQAGGAMRGSAPGSPFLPVPRAASGRHLPSMAPSGSSPISANGTGNVSGRSSASSSPVVAQADAVMVGDAETPVVDGAAAIPGTGSGSGRASPASLTASGLRKRPAACVTAGDASSSATAASS